MRRLSLEHGASYRDGSNIALSSSRRLDYCNSDRGPAFHFRHGHSQMYSFEARAKIQNLLVGKLSQVHSRTSEVMHSQHGDLCSRGEYVRFVMESVNIRY